MHALVAVLWLGGLLGSTFGLAADAAASERWEAVLVETAGPSGPVAQAAQALGVRVGWTYSLIDAFSAEAPASLLPRLAALPGVVSVVPDAAVVATMDVSAATIRADRAWATGLRGDNVTVAILDTGVETSDPALRGAIVACVSPSTGLLGGRTYRNTCSDGNGHGTHVAGTVASRDPLVPGIAPGASLAVVRVLDFLGRGSTSTILAGMEWVAQNHERTVPPIRVATMSIGYSNPGCGDGNDAWARATDALVARGLLVTVAAGNSGHGRCTVDGAAAARSALTVGASDDRGTVDRSDDTIASFSSAGPTRDGRAKPEVVAPGVGIRSLSHGTGTRVMSGTSMATPHVAGVAALLFSAEPSLDATVAKQRIERAASMPRPSMPAPERVWGYGLVDACEALRSAGCVEA